MWIIGLLNLYYFVAIPNAKISAYFQFSYYFLIDLVQIAQADSFSQFQQQYFPIQNFEFFDTMFGSRLVMGAVFNKTLDPSAFPFHGSLSCLQMFTRALNPAQIQYKSNCTDGAKYMSPVCPTGFQFYDGTCISVHLTLVSDTLWNVLIHIECNDSFNMSVQNRLYSNNRRSQGHLSLHQPNQPVCQHQLTFLIDTSWSAHTIIAGWSMPCL